MMMDGHRSFMGFLCLSSLCLLSLTPERSEGQAQSSLRLAQSTDCGRLDEIPGDLRTKVPWTASIFIRVQNGEYKFWLHGVILGPTTVLSVAGGSFGEPLTSKQGKYKIPNPKKIRIGAALTSSNTEEQDSHAQFSDVTYILPYGHHEPVNKKFHFMLYHLKTPLDLTGPHVRAICMPFVLRGRTSSPFEFQFTQGGFVNPPREDGSMELGVFKVLGGKEQECEESFVSRYNETADHVFCGRVNPGSNPNNQCLVHGSVVAFPLSNHWFLAGIAALIPAPEAQTCNPSGLYFYGRTLTHLDWIFNSFKCSPNMFACEDSGSCIPLSSVCNSVPDCGDKSDEDPRLCAAENHCSGNVLTHGCGLNGKCISKDQLCNRKRDCPDGSDENPFFCSTGS
ncbi:unnamed protein product [Allacma fusca]|uniref:Peptidase S1 domain-containing protein n=1 Tax=Allacma fusca TaxID=39272 RepID=A0A8J2KYW7_9HEXA|nr:unnamed protein product [Allacma fusca]